MAGKRPRSIAAQLGAQAVVAGGHRVEVAGVLVGHGGSVVECRRSRPTSSPVWTTSRAAMSAARASPRCGTSATTSASARSAAPPAWPTPRATSSSCPTTSARAARSAPRATRSSTSCCAAARPSRSTTGRSTRRPARSCSSAIRRSPGRRWRPPPGPRCSRSAARRTPPTPWRRGSSGCWRSRRRRIRTGRPPGAGYRVPPMSSFYVTTPIYYVNAVPHAGHAYTAIAVDVMARHHRQRGEDVFFLTGTDEHGEPVADAAKAQGLDPKELADRNAERFQALMPRLEATNDFFIRTSDPHHVAKVQEVLQRVHDNGHVYKGLYEGWYCPRCADFKVENEIAEGNRCPIHEIELVREQEENWFFRLSTFQQQ